MHPLKTLAACLSLLALGSPALAADATAANKRLVIDFFNFNGTRSERAEQMLTPDYVQHNPRFLAWERVLGVHAREAWVKVLPDATAKRVRFVDLGGISLRRPIIVMVENDLVHAVYKGQLPDPRVAGKTVDAFAFEAFRIRDGRFAEHWDQVRLAPGWMTPSPTSLAPGQADVGPAPVPQPPAGCTATPEQLAANKALARSMFEPAGPAALRARLAPGYVEHAPHPLESRNRGGAPMKPDLVIADCDYVAIVWSQTTADPDHAGQTYQAFTFDTFRVANGRIAEHWDGSTP